MAFDKNTTRDWRRRIRDILNRDWDPISGSAADEYEEYADRLLAMIRDDATEPQLLSYLEWAEVEHMGLGLPFDRERGDRVVAALRALGPTP